MPARSQQTAMRNDSDGSTDEADEAGTVAILGLSRLQGYESQVRYSGIFTETITPPNPPTWSANQAFVSGGDLTVTGSCTIMGSNGSVHSNQYLDLGGSSTVTGNATSSNGGSVDPGNVGGTVDTAAPQVAIPDINLGTMQAVRDQAIADGVDVYLLADNGAVYKDGVLVSAGGSYHGWSMSGDTWTLSSNAADLDGLFYAPKSVSVTGCKQGVSMTVLTEGNVTLSGNGEFTAYYDHYFIVSLKDIRVSGTPQETGDLGIIMAREQVKTTGNAFIRGTIIAADLDNASGFVESTTISDMLDQSMITGNFTVEYNGNYTTSFPIYDPNANKFKLDPTFAAYEER